MNCHSFNRFFSAFLDGELDPSRFSACQAHLQDCPRCHRLAEAYRTGVEGFRAAPALQAPSPEVLLARIEAVAGQAAAGGEVIRLGRTRYWAPAAAAAVVLSAVIGFSLFHTEADSYSRHLAAVRDSTLDVVNVLHAELYAGTEDQAGPAELVTVGYEERREQEESGQVSAQDPVFVLGGVSENSE